MFTAEQSIAVPDPAPVSLISQRGTLQAIKMLVFFLAQAEDQVS
ncbi:hypothetical protein [Oceanobacillus neutriphilus]|nr:hypothetical protein [Oceanobacillus neutriphilus]